MTSTNKNISYAEEGEEIELDPLNPSVPIETENRATGTNEEPTGADIARDGGSGDEEGGEPGTENVENVSAKGEGVRCWI